MCPRCKSLKWDVPKIRRPPYLGGGLGITEIIAPNRREIRALVRKHGFSNPRVFGSVARSEAEPGSDVDLLVARRGGGLLDRAGLAIDLSKLLGRPVDVVPEGSLKWYAEPEVLAQAVPV
jgi:predicted nucleotidyltransferase